MPPSQPQFTRGRFRRSLNVFATGHPSSWRPKLRQREQPEQGGILSRPLEIRYPLILNSALAPRACREYMALRHQGTFDDNISGRLWNFAGYI